MVIIIKFKYIPEFPHNQGKKGPAICFIVVFILKEK